MRRFVMAVACGFAAALSTGTPSVALASAGAEAAARRGESDDSEWASPLRLGFATRGGAHGDGRSGRGPTTRDALGPPGGRAPHMPEIDPSVVGGAIALVAGGLAILRDRRRRRF